jgi:hypothetical protein
MKAAEGGPPASRNESTSERKIGLKSSKSGITDDQFSGLGIES